jgi:hypothetical protein
MPSPYAKRVQFRIIFPVLLELLSPTLNYLINKNFNYLAEQKGEIKE